MARQQEEDSGKGIGDRKRRVQEVDSKVDILHTLHILTCYMPSISAHTAYAFLHMLFVEYVIHILLHVQRLFPCFAVYLLLALLMHTPYTSHISMHTVVRSTPLRHIVASRDRYSRYSITLHSS